MSHTGEAAGRTTMMVLATAEQWAALQRLLQDACKDRDQQLTLVSPGPEQVCDISVDGHAIRLRRATLSPDMTEDDVSRALHACFRACSDGTSLFMLLIGGGAFAQMERRVTKVLQTSFGTEALRYLTVVSVEGGQAVERLDDNLLDLIKACDGRFCRVAPHAAAAGLRDLVKTVDDVVRENSSSGYTQAHLSAAERRSNEDQAVEILRQKLERAQEEERVFRQQVQQREATRTRELQELKARQAGERQQDAADSREYESRRQSLEEAFRSLTVQLQGTPPADEDSRQTSVILLGLSGSGKSAALSLLLQRAGARYSPDDGSVPDGEAPPTVRCQRKEVSASAAGGRRLILVDTPELWDEDGVEDVEQVKDCLALALPGPHTFLLVLQVGRFTRGESDMLAHLQRIFGREFAEHAVVLFVRAECERRRNWRVEDYLSGAHPALRDLVRKCGSRYYELNVAKSQNALSYPQVKDLLLGIDKLVAAHGGQAYCTRRFLPQELQERSKEMEERKEGGQEGNFLLREA